MVAGQLEIQLLSNVARLSKDMKATRRSVSGAMGDVEKKVNSAKKVLGALGAGFSVALITNELRKAGKDAVEFQKSLSEVSTLLDGIDQMPRIAQEAKNLAKEFGGTATGQAKAFYQAISAGAANAEEATVILTAANKLAIGGVTDVATSVDGLTTILNAYSLDATSSTSVSDALFVAMKAGKTTVGELSGSIGKLAPVASAAGLTFEEMLASVSTLTTQGISTSEAMSGMKAAISNILKPTADAIEEADRLGTSFNLQALEAQGLQGFLNTLIKETGGSKESMVKLFGSVEALNAVFALTAGGGETFNAIMADMNTKAGQTEIAVIKMRETFDQQFSELTAKMSVSRLELGEFLISLSSPIVTSANENYDDIVDTMGFLAKAVGLLAAALTTKLIVAFIAAQAESIRYQAALARMAGVSRSASLATAGLTTATTSFRGALALLGGPIGITITALALLAVGYRNVKKAQDEAITGAVDWISGTGGLDSVNLAVKGTVDEIGLLEASIQSVGRSMQDPSDTQEFLRLKGLQADKIEFLSRLITEQTRLQDIATAEQEKATKAAESAAISVGVLNQKTIDLTNAKNDLLGVDLSLTSAISDQDFVMGGVITSTDDYSDSVDELISNLRQEAADLGRSERQLFILTQTRQLGTEATWFEIEAVRENAAALFDARAEMERVARATAAMTTNIEGFVGPLTVAQMRARDLAGALGCPGDEGSLSETIKCAEEAEDTTAGAVGRGTESMRIQQNMVENIQRAWGDLFTDLLEGEISFDNFFDSIIDGYKRMIAELAAKSITDAMFGDGGGGLSSLIPGGGGGESSSSDSGGIPGGGGSLISTAANVVSGAAGIGTAATGGFTALPASMGGGALANVASFATNPVTLAIAAAIIIAKNLDKSGTFTSNAGILTQDLFPDSDRTFDLPEFASGADFTGFARREDQGAAVDVASAFSAVDLALTEAIRSAGFDVNLNASDFIGFNEKGQGRGAFFGRAAEDGGSDGVPVEDQLLTFTKRFLELVARDNAGISVSDIRELTSGKTTEEIISAVQDLSVSAIESEAAIAAAFADSREASKFLRETELGNVIGLEAELVGVRSAAETELTLIRDSGIDGLEVREAELVSIRIAAEERIQLIRESGLLRLAQLEAGQLTSFGQEARKTLNEEIEERRADPIRDFLGDNAFDINSITDEDLQSAAGVRDRLSDPVFAKTLWDNMPVDTRPDDWRDIMTPGSVDGSFASGLDFVPFDGFRAELHKGERVQSERAARSSDSTASEVKGLRSDFGNMQIALNNLVASSNQTARALDQSIRNGNGSLAVVVQ